ncbi:pirin family protein [Marinicella sp. S1101]|uniref:pirin family protein n=1 Tax=Marinicella marina TaxID=2996016 RepID=UPI0022609D7B|nr:pirin family protein [Marinicella marina]MCX7552735.1 pirin family protein [Marinicella marina]MDJ1139956.1 pirin family protein [Marinicella marina]
MTQTTITRLIEPREKDLGGFSVRRILPVAGQRMIGPWIFFDHMGPADFKAGQGINVRPHPHINLATVTYLFEGEIYHRDSLGSSEPIVPGDINLMVAGKGIVHSERERDFIRNQDHKLDGLQLWLALPQADEEIDPAFYHYDRKAIPGKDIDGVPVRVMMGSAFGLQSPVKTFAETLYIEATLQQGQSLLLPTAAERGLYVAKGSVLIADKVIDSYHMAVLDAVEVTITAQHDNTRIALIGGENIGARFIDWNFVSSRQSRIEQAKDDWREQRFPSVPGDDKEYIPLPE